MMGKENKDAGGRAEEATFEVTRSFRKAGSPEPTSESSDSGTICVRRFLTEPAKVVVNYGLTINLGNFESARVDVAAYVPCYKEEMDDAYEFASEFVTKRIAKEKEEISTGRNTSQF
jgi:hypothetical protein